MICYVKFNVTLQLLSWFSGENESNQIKQKLCSAKKSPPGNVQEKKTRKREKQEARLDLHELKQNTWHWATLCITVYI